MIDPLALALRELRDSPHTEAAGWKDAADADSLRRILARRGYAVVPAAPTREMWAAGGTAQVQTRDTHYDRAVDAIWRAMLAAYAKQQEAAIAGAP